MPLVYNKLWKLLIDKKFNKSKLRELTGISQATLAKLSKGQNVNTATLEKICSVLNCNVEDIVEFSREEDKNMQLSVGSVCSGIEAASVAWLPLGMKFEWFSEIAKFPSDVLKYRYPNVKNLGDMNNLPAMILNSEIVAPDLICGGTPCQAFSNAGLQKGLNDSRGNLTLKFVEIVDANDKIRLEQGKKRTIVFWENVEGVLSDKTNAFGCLISSLAGLEDAIKEIKWPSAGIIFGTKRNVAWRVLDAKYFGVPQQRKRLYLVAGDKDFHPENVLFEKKSTVSKNYPKGDLTFSKNGIDFEIFREYTDCLYSAYGTKWNGNAAATNGSLFVAQNKRIRRFSPLEAERLMGLPDNYTNIPNCKKTNRYQAIGNSWVVPVIQWIGKRIMNPKSCELNLSKQTLLNNGLKVIKKDGTLYFPIGKDNITIDFSFEINTSDVPELCTYKSLKDIVSIDAPNDIYLSPTACYGILRRKKERNLKINARLEFLLNVISSEMPKEEIEKKSRKQKRGKFSE